MQAKVESLLYLFILSDFNYDRSYLAKNCCSLDLGLSLFLDISCFQYFGHHHEHDVSGAL